MVKVLVVGPQHDIPTALSATAIIRFIDYLKSKKIEFKALLGLAAWRWAFDAMVNDFDLIVYMGHGTEEQLVGENIISAYSGRDSLLDLLNVKLIKKQCIIYTMACLSGLKLGPAAGEQNITYFGHKTYYMGAFNNPTHNFYDDWVDYTTLIPKQLLDGYTPQAALGSYQRAITKYIQEYEANSWDNKDYEINNSKSNRDYMHVFGPNDSLKL